MGHMKPSIKITTKDGTVTKFVQTPKPKKAGVKRKKVRRAKR